MTSDGMTLIDQPGLVASASSPLRRRLLERLAQPGSASQVAAEMDLPRQRVGYHLRELEKVGLVQLVGERQRRGCTERLLQTTATTFVVDPGVLGGAPPSRESVRAQDRYAASHLVEAASATVRDVARMQAGADRAGTRLLTFTMEADVRFARPDDVHDFAEALAEALAATAARFDTPGGRPHRVLVGGHPAPPLPPPPTSPPPPPTPPPTSPPTSHPSEQTEETLP